MEWESVRLDQPPKTFKDNYIDSLVELKEGDGIYSVVEKNNTKYLVYIMKLPEKANNDESLIEISQSMFDNL